MPTLPQPRFINPVLHFGFENATRFMGMGVASAGTGPPPYAPTVLNPETVLKIGANQVTP